MRYRETEECIWSWKNLICPESFALQLRYTALMWSHFYEWVHRQHQCVCVFVFLFLYGPTLTATFYCEAIYTCDNILAGPHKVYH